MPLDLARLPPYRPVTPGLYRPDGRLVVPVAHWAFICFARQLVVVVAVN